MVGGLNQVFLRLVEQINALKSQERGFAEERNKSSHRITEIRSQLKAMMRADEKIAEAENKIYSLRSELARVRLDMYHLQLSPLFCHYELTQW